MGVHAQVPGMRSMEAVRTVWRTAAAVCFDVDSTIVSEEGIDVLAAHCGAGEAVAEWTARAMGGGIPFEVALEERLKLIQPSRAAVEACINAHPLPLTPGVAELVNALRKSGKRVFLVSGGFRQMIVPVAKALEIPMEDVFANDLLFDEDGQFAGFNRDEPTSRSGGKAVVIERLKTERKVPSVVMVGDGATDAEACPPADAFIGFGGVQVRESVKALAPWYATSMAELHDELKREPLQQPAA